jgi:hypothetical protein
VDAPQSPVDPALAAEASRTAQASLLVKVQALESSKRRLLAAAVLALLVHLPLTPAAPVARVLHRLSGKSEQAEKAPPPEPIEVDFRQAVNREETRKRERERPEPPSEGPAPVQATPPSSVKFAAASAEKPPDPAAEKQKEPKKEKVKAIGIEGQAAKKILGKPGVTLGLWFSGLREHELGKQLAELAACNREWRQFIDQGVDLRNDFHGVLVVGPDLYDPAQMTAAVHHGLPATRVRGVMEALVQQSGARGRWLEPNVASARVGKNQRVLLPQQEDLFFVAPSKGWQALHESKAPLRVPSADGRTASLVLVKPQRTLKRLGLSLPKPIDELRLEAFVNLDQSVDVKVELEATTKEAAALEAKRVGRDLHEFFADTWMLTATLGALTGKASDGARAEPPPALDLEVDERTLSGTVHLSPNQAKMTLSLLSSVMCKKRASK